MIRIKSLVFRLLLGLIVSSAVLSLYIYDYDRLDTKACRFPGPQDAQIKLVAFGDPQIRGWVSSDPPRKKLDIYGNDHYLGHVYNVLMKKLEPGVVAVMGDLLSSQWIDDNEFFSRVERYQNRIFVPRPGIELVNVSGNHDVGYAGEMTVERVGRYRKAFGEVNFVHDYGSWRIVVVNSLALDGPAYDPQFQTQTNDFLAQLKDTPYGGATVLLSHVPLYKRAGLCSDGPLFNYYEWGTLREQNHLSNEATQRLLNAAFPVNGAGGVILAGHDHEGCKVTYQKTSQGQWESTQFDPKGGSTGPEYVQEYTVRSMMGEYGGNGGLLQGTVDATTGQWKFDYRLCRFAVQHVWWVAKVVNIITLVSVVVYAIAWGLIKFGVVPKSAGIGGAAPFTSSNSVGRNHKDEFLKAPVPIALRATGAINNDRPASPRIITKYD